MFKLLRRAAGMVYRQVNPTPEVAAWRRVDALAGSVPRHTVGRVQLLDYDVEYADLLSFCPQFHDIFVPCAVPPEFHTTSASPRILDCGSNIGTANLAFKRQYPGARVTAVRKPTRRFTQ